MFAKLVWARLAAVAAVVCILTVPAAANPTVPFAAIFFGDFTITFGTGPSGTDDLRFEGDGIATNLGCADVDGHSTTQPRPDDPTISDIKSDEVVLTAPDGDQLRLRNSGQDRLDTSVPGHTFIRGSGTFVVTGGTGRFRHATGSGEFHVFAEVLGTVLGGVNGHFALAFDGRISQHP